MELAVSASGGRWRPSCHAGIAPVNYCRQAHQCVVVWFSTFLVSIPYVWVLARGVGILGRALALGFFVGTLLAVGLGSIGLLISAACNSNKTSITASIFLLLLLFAPTQLPSGLPQGWFFDVLLRANPVASGLAYILDPRRGPWLDAGPVPADHTAAHGDLRAAHSYSRVHGSSD